MKHQGWAVSRQDPHWGRKVWIPEGWRSWIWGLQGEQELADTDLLNWFFQPSLSARTAGIFVWNSTALSDEEWLDE